MSGFIVRIHPDKSPAEAQLVGIFWCRSLVGLRDMVDECTDPNACEYAVLPAGGLYWNGVAPVVPMKVSEEAEEFPPFPPAGAEITEGLARAIYVVGRDRARLRWKALVPDGRIYVPGFDLMDAGDPAAQLVHQHLEGK